MQVRENLTLPANAAMVRYLRVKLSGGKLVTCDATDVGLGTNVDRATAADQLMTVLPWNAPGTRRMVAAGAVTQYANVYGAAGGKVDDVANENFVGVAMAAASGDNSEIEVYAFARPADVFALGSIDGNLVLDDDFIGDYPAAATALAGQGPYAWTKTETDGLGVISSDEANGVLKFSADAVAEACTAALYLANSPFDVDKSPIFECRLAIFDKGDDAALDIDFGLASDTHATDFEAIAAFAAFHLDGNSLLVKAHSDDGTTDTAAVTTGVTVVDDAYNNFKIDCTDKADVKFFINGVRVASGTTFDISAYTGTLTPIVLVEKTSNDTTFDVRVDRIRVQAIRN